MTRAALYGRVSTDEQTEKFGLSSQMYELRALADKRGYHVADGGEFADDGYTGTELDRPALTRLRDAAHAGLFQVVLVHDPDRLSRNLGHLLLLEEEFEKEGVRLEFLTTPREDTPEGQLLLHVKGAVSQYERSKIRERTLRGKREKARRGLIPAGPVPYGYRADPNAPGKLLVDADEAAVVRMVFEWLVTEGRSIRAITTTLGELGIRAARGRKWAKSSVRRVLTSEVYVGRAWFNRRQRRGTELRPRQVSEWLPISVPPVVPEAVFQSAQTQLAQNRETLAGRPPSRLYLLRGLLRCQCGRKLCGNVSHGRREYRCAGRDRLAGAERCRKRPLNADDMEALVWHVVTDALRQPELLSEKMEAYRVQLGAREVEVRSELEHLDRQLTELERREARLLDLYLEEGLQVPALKERLADLREQKTGLKDRIARARAQLDAHEAEVGRQEAIKRFCEQVLRGLDQLAPEGRQRLLQTLLDSVLVSPEALEIRGVLPGRTLPPGLRLTEPNLKRLWPPAAAISSARLAQRWPRTSARSSSSACGPAFQASSSWR